MAAIAIKEEAPDTYSPKIPTKGGGGCGGINVNQGKTKTAPKVANNVDRRKDLSSKNKKATTAAKTKSQRNGFLKDAEDATEQKRPALETHNLNSTRCGEIFVTNNTNKWTFVCTFCQKSTRDIGEFVCHIKFKHMSYSNFDDIESCGTDTANEYNAQREQMMDHNPIEESYNQGQDYIDCTNYLDVNVHTEDSDDLSSYKQQIPSLFKPIPPTKQSKVEKLVKKENDVVSLLDDDDDDGDEFNAANKKQADDEPMYFDYDYDGQDEEEGIQVVDDMDDETDRMDDDSNQLLLRRSSTEGGDSNNTLGFDFDDTKRYRSHVKGTAYCELCDKTFQYYSLYRNHMIKHSNVTPFKCQFCNKGFKSKQAIRYHMNTHAKEKPYSCPVCATTYATSSLFMSHVMNHEGDDCFPCMVCTKIFKTEREREVHLESHSQERPHSCTFCSKRFRQKHHLSNHLKLHCQYRCDFCKNSFNSTQTQRRPYACQTCESMPDIRQQVERQRAVTTKTQDGPPLMKFENVMLQSTTTATTASPEVAVEVASDEEESEESNTVLVSTGRKKFPQCKYCRTTYTHVGALNFHLRQKHPEHFT